MSVLSLPNSHTFCKTSLASAVALGLLTWSHALKAQEPIILEEVIITSLKRPQSLQDVPISVAAIEGEKLEQMGIENLEDLTSYVPNLHFTETGIGTQIRIRGIGSDNSQGFEQSVGVYVDGIQHGRAQLLRAPIFDMERVEVMRGPQGTLFGKNSIAGALDLITAKPTEEFEGSISASHEAEFGTKEYTGVISGPMSDKVRARLAMRGYDDPGYVKNNFKGTDEANQEEFTARLSVELDFTEALQAQFKVEHSTFDILGRFSETTQDLPAADTAPSYGQVLANPAFNDGVNPGPTIDPNFDFERNINAGDYSNNTIDTYTLRLDYNWEDFTITSVTGQVGFEYDENCDCDYTPATIFDLDLNEDYEQISQELRIASSNKGNIEWVAGVFFQDYEQRFNDQFNLPTNTLLPTFLSLSPNLNDATKAILPVLSGSGIKRYFYQRSKTLAAFGEVAWEYAHNLSITVGARFTTEEKEAYKTLDSVDITNGNVPLTGGTAAAASALFYGIFGVETDQLAPNGHTLSETRDESGFTPSITFSFFPNDEQMNYIKASKGFKAGGFDPRSNNTANFEFEDEEVLAYELGTKQTLAGGRGEINAALYYMDYDNLQISQFDGGIGFNIGNAKGTVVQGIEIDGRWQLNNHFSSRFGITYLDFEYKDFKNGNCYEGQTAPIDPETDAPRVDPETGTQICDYTGKRGVYTPKLTLNGSLTYSRPLTDDITYIQVLEAQWVDEQVVHVNQDPTGDMDAYMLASLRIGIETESWQLALLGKNLLDEEIRTYSGNTPLSGLLAGSNTHYSFVARPRTIALTGSYKF